MLRDIVAEHFDAGIRMAAVATPAYFKKHGKPKVPQDLATHRCINLRLPTLGGVYAWEVEKDTREINVRVEGQLTVNDIAVIRNAALHGLGIAFMPEDVAQPHLDAGDLVRVLADWTPPFPGYHLHYPSRRRQSPAFALLVEALRYRG